jgi:pimeloyl-ACP methyl ester carboxylesterase
MSAKPGRQIRVNGLEFHCIEAGQGEPILFLHGFPEQAQAWSRIMDRLSGRFRTIAIDTRGVHRSEAPAEVSAYHVSELVEDVRQLMAVLGYRRMSLVGHDWGGFIAWEFAMRYPELLDRLVIVNAAHTGVFDRLLREDEQQAAASKYMLAFRSPRGEELVSRNDFAGFRQEILEPALARGALTEGQAEDYLAAWRDPQSLTAGLNYYRANRSGPLSGDDNPPRDPAETVVNVPTLIIWGERDRYFVPRNLDLVPEVVPDLVIRRFPENSHWIVHERPEEVSDLIGEFVSGALTDTSPKGLRKNG